MRAPTRCRHLLMLVALALALALPAARAAASWTFGTTGLANVNSARSVAFGNGRFVATLEGANGCPALAWSVDGVTWNAAGAGLATQGTVVFTAGSFYLASNNAMWRSQDGVAWERLYTDSVSVNHVATDGRSMLVSNSQSRPSLLFSPDLVTWRETTALPNASATTGAYVQDLVYFAGRYYALYLVQQPDHSLRSYTASTVDGTEWADVPALAKALYLASSGGRLIARMSGNGNPVTTTTDGVTFTTAPIPGGSNIGALGYAGGRFFDCTSLLTSIDGSAWGPLTTGTPGANIDLWDVAYGNGRYVVVGEVIASLAASAPPLFATLPQDQTVVVGTAVTFSVTIENPDVSTTFQWRRNGLAIPGATSPTLQLPAVSLADAGQISCEARNAIGASLSTPATLTVVPVTEGGRIVNLSVLTSLESEDFFTMGFAVNGSGDKPVLVRAAGPSLTLLGVGVVNADPRVELYAESTKTAENDNWGGSTALMQAFNRVSAFGFISGTSADAALVSSKPLANLNSVRVYGAKGTHGMVLAEVYDLTMADQITVNTPRLCNVSVLKSVAAGEVLTAGFSLGGRTAKTLLIRAAGPSLTQLNQTDVLPNPVLNLFRLGASTPMATNDDWDAALKTAFERVSAFGFIAGSKDAALLVTLPPGGYAVQATGGSGAGKLLVEIYEVP